MTAIELTSEWTKAGLARAVPGAYWDGDYGERGSWVLDDPSPRGAAVALQLFPHLNALPELIELRETLIRDATPIDFATPYYEASGSPDMSAIAPRVADVLTAKGWSLHDYQLVDINYAVACLSAHGGFYKAWARGKGKTLATCCVLDSIGAAASLVVAPNTAKSSVWGDALAEFCPWLEVLVLPNDIVRRERCLARATELAAAGEPFVLVVHYEALAVIAGKNKPDGKKHTTILDGWKKLKIRWDIKVFDEGHRLANVKSMQSRAALKVPAAKALLLSGSVFQNRWEELFGPLKVLFPTRYKAADRDWNLRFLDYVANGYGRTCIGVLPERVGAMRDELGRFMAYRDKVSLAIPSVVKVQMSAEQARVYAELVEQCLSELEDGTRIKVTTGVAMLTKLRQVATGLDLFSKQVADSTKLDAAIRIIQRDWDRGDDYVVFCWYKSSAAALEARLAALGIDSWVITGDVKMKDRDDAIRRFTAGEKRVMIGTIPTMGESVNLQRANHVIRLDRSFNPALNLQAVDRVDRQGQTREVYLDDIIAEGTVDELVVLPKLMNKEALAAAVFGSQGGPPSDGLPGSPGLSERAMNANLHLRSRS